MSTLTRVQALRWRNAVFAVFFTMGFGFASFISRVPHVRTMLDASTAEMGLLLLGISIGSVSGLVVAAQIIHWFGSHRVATGGMVIVATGLALSGWAVDLQSSWLVFAGFVVTGLMTGVADVAMNVSGAANEQVLGRTIMPVFHAFFSFGTVVGAGFGALSQWLSISLGVQMTIVLGAITVVAIIAFRFLVPDDAPSADDRIDLRERLSVWRDPRTILLGLMVLGAALTEGSANDWIALLMVDGHGFSETGGAIMLAVFLTAMTLVRLAGSPLVDRFGRVPVLRATTAAAAVGLLIVIFVDQPVLVVIGTILWGVGGALGFPLGMSAAAEDRRLASARVGAVSTIGYLAFLAGPPLLGFLGEHWTLRVAMLSVLAFVLLAFIVAPVARERNRTAAGDDAGADD